MELGFDEHDAIEEFLDDCILVSLEGICGRLKFELCLLIYGCLRAGRVASVLRGNSAVRDQRKVRTTYRCLECLELQFFRISVFVDLFGSLGAGVL